MSALVHINIHSFSAEVEPDVVISGQVAGQLVDGCSSCLTMARGWYLRPVSVTDQGDRLIAVYHHRRCRKQWRRILSKPDQGAGIGIHGEPDPSRLGDVLRDVVADVARRRSQV